MSLILLATACGGGFKVGLDDETIGAITGDNEDKDNDSDTASQAGDADQNSGDSDDDDEAGSNPSQGNNQTEAGIIFGTPTSGERSFLATFKIRDYNTTCYSDFPVTVRVYHVLSKSAEYLDFETTGGDLAWSARIFPDDTFDFSVGFNYPDVYGNAQILAVPCTCSYRADDYYGDDIDCTCEESDYDADGCTLYYEEY